MIDFQLFHSDILEHICLKLDEETFKKIIKFKEMKIIKYIYNNIPLDFDNEPIYKEMFIQKTFYKIFDNKFIIKKTIIEDTNDITNILISYSLNKIYDNSKKSILFVPNSEIKLNEIGFKCCCCFKPLNASQFSFYNAHCYRDELDYFSQKQHQNIYTLLYESFYLCRNCLIYSEFQYIYHNKIIYSLHNWTMEFKNGIKI